jgi:adenylate cyclase
MSKTHKPKSPLNYEKVSHQLQRILVSPNFDATPQLIAFLKFDVNQTLAGKAYEITDYTVATEIFDRGPDFDPSTDPIVSVRADVLRRKIDRYYLTAGKHDLIRINIPRSTYAPSFEVRSQFL